MPRGPLPGALRSGLLWLLSGGLGAFADAPPPDIFPSGCTVVLLAGVPGDSETESAYRDQLQAWAGIVASSPGSHPIYVLCDEPASFGLPASSDLHLMTANRTNFVGLASVLPGSTNPLVIVVFGHGGLQGHASVLHVRGPRLTPADFASLAGQLKLAPSRWILMFRGSGAFGRALAGEGRQIVTSECDTKFTSDPIGMAVLLKIVRANPSLTFQEMAVKTGNAIAEWYSSRNLARTEEPTFWDGTAKPRGLAVESAEASPSDTKTSSEQPDHGPKPKSADSPPPTPTEGVQGEQSSTWKEITPVSSRQYPDAEGVVLRRTIRCVVGSNPAFSMEQDEYVQVLSNEGKTLGDFDVAYSPPEEELEFLDCEVRRPDGKIVRLDPEAIGQSQEPSAGEYQAGRRQFFSLPEVGPGAVLHVRYRTQWKEFPLPKVALALPISRELPMLDATVEVSVPKETPFHFLFEELRAPDPVISRTDYSVCYRWHLKEVPEHHRESLSAPHRDARLLFSTFPDWKTFAEWYGRISKLTDEVTPEITAKARELTQNGQNDHEKLVALYAYVNALRYVAVPLGINSLRPHAAGNVLQHQFGDCKDKANLLNALLHALNIRAKLALVPRFSEAYDVVPGVGFNHAISRVSLDGGKTVWVDSTDDICRFGLLPPGDPGRNVLVIEDGASALTQLPEPDPRDHQLRITAELKPVEGDEAWAATISAKAQGYADYELRETVQGSKDSHSSVPLLFARFRPVNGSFMLERQTASSVSAMAEDFCWHGEGSFLGLSSTIEDKRLFRLPLWLPREWDAALHARHSSLFLNRGYPLTLDEQLRVSLPGGARLIDLPSECQGDQGPLRWRIEWTRVSDDTLAAHFQAQLVRGDLSMAETASFQRQLRPLLTALSANVVFGRPTY